MRRARAKSEILRECEDLHREYAEMSEPVPAPARAVDSFDAWAENMRRGMRRAWIMRRLGALQGELDATYRGKP